MLIMAAAIALGLASSITAAAPEPLRLTPVAVELFTSQGCSSCPPADALLEQLSRQPKVIAISRPVTYWDRLGWKDTLAREANTELQRAYAAKRLQGSGVYTPQIVVQGGEGAVGSDGASVRRLVALEKAKPGLSITAERSADGGRAVKISGAGRQSGQVSIVALKGEVVVRIGSGENGGRTVRYTNVALSDAQVGNFDGRALSLQIPGRNFNVSGADRYAILVRAGPAGRILAARYI